MIIKQGTVPVGYTQLDPSPPRAYLLAQLALTASGPCRIRFGKSGGPFVSPDIFLTTGVPYILPFNDQGWLSFPAGQQIGADVTVTSGTPTVGIIAGFEPA